MELSEKVLKQKQKFPPVTIESMRDYNKLVEEERLRDKYIGLGQQTNAHNVQTRIVALAKKHGVE